MSDFIIEISTCGSVTACTNDGGILLGDTLDDVLDCTASGDCEPACRYVLETYNIEYRTVKNIDGKYQSVIASPDDKKNVCESIYFESDTDFTDEESCDLYLVWEAANQVKSEVEYLLGESE
jgi:hypothetical protein